jgi:hypothetical protein
VDLTGKDLENSLGQPYPGRGTIRDFYNQTPKTGALYIVDKMEYGQMIAHVGFRYEYFIQANDASAAEEAAIGEDIPYADYRDRFAPRIAFAYPISDTSTNCRRYSKCMRVRRLPTALRGSSAT